MAVHDCDSPTICRDVHAVVHGCYHAVTLVYVSFSAFLSIDCSSPAVTLLNAYLSCILAFISQGFSSLSPLTHPRDLDQDSALVYKS